jgi:TolB-like protein/Tfp pilus assembly protein PilF
MGEGEPRPKVFLSYARSDRKQAERLVAALEAAGVEVWWDALIEGGAAFAKSIESTLQKCDAVMVCWSRESVVSDWVLDEAERGRDLHKLVAVSLDGTEPPLGFRQYHAVDLASWRGEAGAAEVAAVARGIASAAGRAGESPSAARAPPPRTRVSRRRALEIAAGAAAAIVAGIAAWQWWPTGQVATTHAPTSGEQPSIAILPFVDMSENRDQEYFADGLAEDVRNVLATIPSLKVIGRSSSFQFKGKSEDLRAIGTRLDAAYVLEGSVRRSGDRVRVTANLIRTADGIQQWTQGYDRAFGDVLELQDELASGIARALEVYVSADDLRTGTRLDSPVAYDLYLRALHASDRQDREGFESAAHYLQQALQLDPEFAAAAAQLAFVQMVQADFGFAPVRESYERARRTAMKAIQLDPQAGRPHAILGWIHTTYDWDWAAADAQFKQALAKSPYDTLALNCYARLVEVSGDWTKAARAVSTGFTRDPLNPAGHNILSGIYLRAGRLAEAEEEIRKVMEISPTYESAPYHLGIVLLMRGRAAEALAAMQQIRNERMRTRGLASVYHALDRRAESDAALTWLAREHAHDDALGIAQAHAFRGELEDALRWLDRAYAQKDAGIHHIKGDPLLRGLAGDARYQAFLRRLKIPP